MASQTESDPHHGRTGALVWIRRHAQLRTVVPALVGLGLVAYVVNIASTPKSGAEFWSVVRGTWWIILLLTIPYLVTRAFVWWGLLKQLGLDIPWRPLAVAFAGGEMTKMLPAGIYAENYLLTRLEHFRSRGTVRSSMATTATLGLESLVAVPVLLVLGIPGFPWLRLTILALVGAWLLFIAFTWAAVRFGRRHLDAGSPGWLRQGFELADDFLKAGRSLIAWRTLALAAPTAAYLLIYAVDIFSIMRSAGVDTVSFADAIAVYAFVVLTVILIPIPTEIGLTEFSGLSALEAFGIPQASAAVVILSLRALATGMTMLAAGLVILALRSQLTHPDT